MDYRLIFKVVNGKKRLIDIQWIPGPLEPDLNKNFEIWKDERRKRTRRK